MFSFMVFKTAKDIKTFVNDSRVYPRRRETPEVGSFSAFVYMVFFALFFCYEDFPAGIYFFEDGHYLVESIFAWVAIFENIIDAVLSSYRGFKF